MGRLEEFVFGHVLRFGLRWLERRNLWVPQLAWEAWQAVCLIPLNDVVIPRKNPAGEWEFLLTRREENDPEWPGRPWHIPGGKWRPWVRDKQTGVRVACSQESACCEVTRAELSGLEIDLVHEVGTCFWDEFGYRYPVTHTVICFPKGPVAETEDRKFFSVRDLPNNMIRRQGGFLEQAEEWLMVNR